MQSTAKYLLNHVLETSGDPSYGIFEEIVSVD